LIYYLPTTATLQRSTNLIHWHSDPPPWRKPSGFYRVFSSN
jgi:hypothetical protein